MENDENKYPAIFATPMSGIRYTLNISQVFGDAYTFDEAIHILSVATPDDVIIVNINSDGGNLYSLIALRNAIRTTQATIHMNLLGIGASAGGALFLEPAHSYTVHDNTCLMIHNMICGTGYDDTIKIVTRAEHNRKVNERFVRETYKDFLSDGEIESVLNGTEIYLEDWDIRERLIKRNQILSESGEVGENEADDLSQFTDDEIKEEITLCEKDIEDYKAELRRRLDVNN